MSTEAREIRPNRRVFVIRSTFRTGIFTLPLVLLAMAVAPAIEIGVGLALVVGLGLWLAIVAFRFVQRTVIFGKTRYLMYPDRIVLETGGLVSERSVDLQFTNVTRSVLTLPFIENKLYETGHVTVQAAGSSAAEIVMESVDEPDEVFEGVSEALRANGFSLERAQVVQQEKPGFVGSLYELGAPVVTSALVLLFVIPDLVEMFLAISELESVSQLMNALSTGELLAEAVSIWSILAGVVLFLGGAAVFVAFFALRWLDILKRTYTLNDDVIDYTDGFLTRHHSFIPVENLTDVEIDEQLVQRILGISTIKVSCQGAGVDIRLGAVPNGEQFKANLERLIDETGPPISSRESIAEPRPVDEARSDEHRPRAPAERLPKVEGAYDWKRDIGSAVIGLIPLLLLFSLPIGFVAFQSPEGALAGLGLGGMLAVMAVFLLGSRLVKTLMQTFALGYAVDDRKVTHNYNLLSKKQTEFTIDKISAVEIKRSLLDRWFGTAQVSFTSIGATEKIKFEHLANAETVIGAVLNRMGIEPEATEEHYEPQFSPTGMLRALDPLFVFFFATFWLSFAAVGFAVEAVVIPVLLLLGAVGRAVYLKLFCDRAALDVGANWLCARTGVIIRRDTYVPAHHVRGIDARRNLGEEQGTLSIRSGGGARAGLGYLDDVWRLQEGLDERLHRSDASEPLDTEKVTDRAPAVFNAVVRLVLLSVVTVFLLPLLPFTIPWVVAATRRVRYELQGSRIARFSGVFRKRRHTILLGRIDHLTTSRGALNRVNDTGSIGVVTLGSGGTDMLVRDVENHREFYETIEGMTKRRLAS